MDTALSAGEKEVIKPYVTRLYEQAFEEGREEGIKLGMKKILRSYIQKNPRLSLEEVATLYDVDIRLVREVTDGIQ